MNSLLREFAAGFEWSFTRIRPGKERLRTNRIGGKPLTREDHLTPDVSLRLFAQLMWEAAAISAPLLLGVLAVGLIVSVLQVVTQIQEMSLTFIPKLATSIAVLTLAGPWMLDELVSYSTALIRSIPRMV